MEYKKLNETKKWLELNFFKGFIPEVGLILGSGLGSFVDSFNSISAINYSKIPGFPVSGVKGHKGQLVIGTLGGKKIAVMQGRVHYYEGYTIQDVVFPIRVLIMAGIKHVVVTNSSGGLNPQFKPNDIMIITDHLNLMATNPLLGKNMDSLGPRFPDMSFPYSEKMIKHAETIFKKLGKDVKKGVYAALTGPSYETPAEVKMLRLLGADAVGMSTVPEVIAARHAGITVLGLSVIANLAAGMTKFKLKHSEVISEGQKAAKLLNDFFKQFLEII